MAKVATLRRHAVRALLTACLATTALSPALAHEDDRDYPGEYREEGRFSDMSRELRDPMNQAKVAGTLSALTGALLSMDVTPMARAMDSVDGGHRAYDRPDARLGDYAGEDVRDLPYDIARKTPEAMGRMAGMLGALEEMRPQLKAMGRQLKRSLREQGLGN